MNHTVEMIYYAVYSDIGFGIFTTTELLEENTYYIEDKYVQAFPTLESAAIYAITGYNTFQYALNLNNVYSGVPSPLSLNHFYTTEDIL